MEEIVKNSRDFVLWLSSSFLLSLELSLTLRILLSKYSIFLVFVFLTCGVAWMMAPLEVFTSGGFPYEEDVVPIETLFKTYTSREFSWGLTSWILLLREPSLDWFQLMAIFVKFGTKANKLSVTVVEPKVIKLMNAPTRISVIVVVKRVILSVIVLIHGALGY